MQLTLRRQNAAMQNALASVKDNPVLLKRVRIQNMALQHLLIITKRSFAMKKTSVPGIDWQNIANDYLKLSDETGNVYLGEGSKMDDNYRSSLVAQGCINSRFPQEPVAPASCAILAAGDWIDMQEDRFTLAGEGTWVNIVGRSGIIQWPDSSNARKHKSMGSPGSTADQ